jgi:hypothetical protein
MAELNIPSHMGYACICHQDHASDTADKRTAAAAARRDEEVHRRRGKGKGGIRWRCSLAKRSDKAEGLCELQDIARLSPTSPIQVSPQHFLLRPTDKGNRGRTSQVRPISS